MYGVTECGFILGYYIDLIYGSAVFIMAFIIDLFTLYFLKKYLFGAKDVNEKSRRKLDIGFFLQV